MITLTYGEIPSFEQFDSNFTKKLGYKTYDIKNSPHDGEFTSKELYDYLKYVCDKEKLSEGSFIDEDDLSFVSSVLFTLGFEWV
jgi:hypothetical protein